MKFAGKMEEQKEIIPRPIFRRDVNWDPFPNWTEPKRIFARDFGLPPFLEPTDIDWLDWAKKRLASFSWPAYAESPLLSPFSSQHLGTSDQNELKQLTEVRTEKDRWTIQLDVKYFSPEELTITTKDGYLQITGKHEERQDEHGGVSRCFTRKYKLPQGVDLQLISSSLSPEGLLFVEAPAPGPGSSSSDTVNELVIPVQIRHTTDH